MEVAAAAPCLWPQYQALASRPLTACTPTWGFWFRTSVSIPASWPFFREPTNCCLRNCYAGLPVQPSLESVEGTSHVVLPNSNILFFAQQPVQEFVYTAQISAMVHCYLPDVTVLRPDYYDQLDYRRLIREQLSYVTVPVVRFYAKNKKVNAILKCVFDAQFPPYGSFLEFRQQFPAYNTMGSLCKRKIRLMMDFYRTKAQAGQNNCSPISRPA